MRGLTRPGDVPYGVPCRRPGAHLRTVGATSSRVAASRDRLLALRSWRRECRACTCPRRRAVPPRRRPELSASAAAGDSAGTPRASQHSRPAPAGSAGRPAVHAGDALAHCGWTPRGGTVGTCASPAPTPRRLPRPAALGVAGDASPHGRTSHAPCCAAAPAPAHAARHDTGTSLRGRQRSGATTEPGYYAVRAHGRPTHRNALRRARGRALRGSVRARARLHRAQAPRRRGSARRASSASR